MNLLKLSSAALLCASFAVLPLSTASACSRAVYFGQGGQTVTGRSMDWTEGMQTNLWIFPRGTERNGGPGNKGLKWTSKYGSVVASVYEAGTADGMNEKGLVANELYLAEAKYPKEDGRPRLTVAAWPQYFLDNFATVKEAVAEMRKEKFIPFAVAPPVTDSKPIEATMHLSLSDASGDSAIFEYINGKLVIHHGRQYQVMTNSPTYDEQLRMNKYWERKGGKELPGTTNAADRFARASYYINASQQSAQPREAVAAVFSVMRNVSAPRGIVGTDWSTIWRTVSDQKNLVYYFEDTFSPSLVWVKLKEIDFTPKAGVRKLALAGNPDLAGDQTANFKPAKPFPFLGS